MSQRSQIDFSKVLLNCYRPNSGCENCRIVVVKNLGSLPDCDVSVKYSLPA